MMKAGSKSCDAGAGPSTERGKWLCDGVCSLYEPEGQPAVEMVFIHGLQLGNSKDACENAYWTTWLASDETEENCWPKTWLPGRFPKARVLSISYDARRALKSFSSGTMDLYPFGESLVQEMVFEGVDIGQHGCPVVFVCHCVGGLVAKQIIVLAHDHFKGDKRIQKLLRNIKAFVFYGTPHGSSELVSLNSEIEVGRLNSRFEAIQRVEFKNKWRFRVIAETHATSSNWLSSSMIVKEPAARHVGYDVMHIAADHFDVCKPKSERDTSFLYLIECVKTVMADNESIQAKVLEVPSLVVGVDDKLLVLCEKLKRNPIVGLVGMGGVGKTTLSRVMYNSEREHYERCSYLEDVKSQRNLVDFQKQLLRDLCDEQWNDSEDSKVYIWKIKQCIATKKVLVVIDDVGTEANLKALHVVAFQSGCSGSNLVITCRDMAILKDYMLEGERMKVDLLDKGESMQLFCHYAFHDFNAVYEVGNVKRDIFESEAVNIVEACDGLPLSIEVIGQYLRKHNDLREDERLELWKDAVRRLKAAEAIEGHSNDDERLWRKLRISYDDLGDVEKRLFLDFACNLCEVKGIDRNTIIRIWDSVSGFQNLINSSLINVAAKQLTPNMSLINVAAKQSTPNMSLNFFEDVVPKSCVEELGMHDQLRDMGRWIVRDLGKRDSQKHMIHMWERDEVIKFMKGKEGSRMLEGLTLTNVGKFCPQKVELKQTFVNKMLCREQNYEYPNLRLLNISGNNLNVVKYILQICSADPQNLRWVCLNETMIKRRHLRILRAKLKELHVLHMRDCEKLVEIPSSIGMSTSLKELNLGGCMRLRSLPDAIGKLGNLQVLILKKCELLRKLPESMGNLVELLELDLSSCQSLRRLPSTLGNLKRLKLLNLRSCENLEAIPAGVGQLVELESLDLGSCLSVRNMCEFDKGMRHLHTLDLGDCVRLERFKSLGNLFSLRTLYMQSCVRLCIANLGECLGQLRELQFLNLQGCRSMGKEVAEAVGNLRTDCLEALCLSTFPETALPLCPQLKFLQLDDSSRLCQEKELPKAFSESLGNLAQLKVLRVKGIESIPESVGNLTQLQALYVDFVPHSSMKLFPDALTELVGLEILRVIELSCERLPELVGDLLSLRELSLLFCRDLVELPLALGSLSQLRSLDLRSCTKLERLPDSLGGLTQLQSLNLDSCENLERLPETLGGLSELRSLDLSKCMKLECLPESLGGLSQLRFLVLEFCKKLERLPDSLGGLTQLQSLNLYSCKKLERLPETLGGLSQLRSLDLSLCTNLECLPDSLGGLSQLRSLSLSFCEKLERLPDSLGGLTQLQFLRVSSCKKLERLPETLGGLSQLRSLDLSSCTNLERLPDSLGGLTQLSDLDVSGCIKLKGKKTIRSIFIERG